MGKRKTVEASATPPKRQRNRNAEDASPPKRAGLAALLQPSTTAGAGGSRPVNRAPRPATTAPAATTAAAAAAKAAGTAEPEASGPGGSAALWCDQHAPVSEADLVVARKKLDELKGWMAAAMSGGPVPSCLILTGPAGCGKSTAVAALARSLGLAPCVWAPPVPTTWGEHRYQRDASAGYTSKVADFEEFAGRTKMAPLPLAPLGPGAAAAAAARAASGDDGGAHASQGEAARPPPDDSLSGAAAVQRKIMVVDDLPHAAGAEQRTRITAALARLAETAGCPVVVELTTTAREESGAGGGQAASMRSLHKDVVDTLESLGAGSLALNPATTAATRKALLGVAAAHGLELAKEDSDALATAAAGDLRSAICSLQLLAAGAKPQAAAAAGKAAAAAAAGKSRKRTSKKAAAAGLAKVTVSSADVLGIKDAALGRFHALGKLLYNKRLPLPPPPSGAAPITADEAADKVAAGPAGQGSRIEERQQQSGACAVAAAAADARPPPEADADEVLERSGLEPGQVVAFVHEHCLSFVDDGAVDEAADALDYQSAADVLASYWGALDTTAGSDPGSHRVSSLTAAIAGSTSARGWMWANSRPAPRRWLPLDAPALFAVQRAAAENGAALRAVLGGHAAAEGVMSDAATFAAAYIPALRVLSSAPYGHGATAARLLPRKWFKVWNKQVHVAHDASSAAGGGRLGSMGSSAVTLGIVPPDDADNQDLDDVIVDD